MRSIQIYLDKRDYAESIAGSRVGRRRGSVGGKELKYDLWNTVRHLEYCKPIFVVIIIIIIIIICNNNNNNNNNNNDNNVTS